MRNQQQVLMLNKMLQTPNEELSSKQKTGQSIGDQLGQTIHDEAIANNKDIFKPGSESIYHTDALSKSMRKMAGKQNMSADDLLKQKIALKKSGLYSQLLKEDGSGGSGSVGSAPIAPMVSNTMIKNKTFLTSKAASKIKKAKEIL